MGNFLVGRLYSIDYVHVPRRSLVPDNPSSAHSQSFAHTAENAQFSRGSVPLDDMQAASRMHSSAQKR